MIYYKESMKYISFSIQVTCKTPFADVTEISGTYLIFHPQRLPPAYHSQFPSLKSKLVSNVRGKFFLRL